MTKKKEKNLEVPEVDILRILLMHAKKEKAQFSIERNKKSLESINLRMQLLNSQKRLEEIDNVSLKMSLKSVSAENDKLIDVIIARTGVNLKDENVVIDDETMKVRYLDDIQEDRI